MHDKQMEHMVKAGVVGVVVGVCSEMVEEKKKQQMFVRPPPPLLFIMSLVIVALI